MVPTTVRNLGEEPAAAWRAACNGAMSILFQIMSMKTKRSGPMRPSYWIHANDQRNRTQ